MILQAGDRDPRVLEIQKLLSILGYDLVIDGIYGPKTKRSVKAFQKKAGLFNDGVITQKTYDTLRAHASQKRVVKDPKEEVAPKRYPLEITRNYKLSSDQYIKQITKKSQIFLHYTAGGPDARNVINYWDSNTPRVATPFVIDSNGNIFECFDPDYWSYHLGIKGTRGRLDKASIGIEMCAYGPLKLKEGQFYAWPGDYSKKIVPKDEVYTLPREFRGFQYYHALSDAQIDACEKLCDYLIKEYDIEVQYEFDYAWFDYDYNVIKNTAPGIWSHTTVRTDKFDLYPDQRILNMLNRLANNHGK